MSIGFQHQIRQNALEMQDYLKDLYDWEEKLNKESNSKLLKPQNNEIIPVRDNPNKNGATLSSSSILKRDTNTIENYYNSWNKIDVVNSKGIRIRKNR